MARSVSACFAMTGKMRSLASALLVAMAIAVVGVEMSTCTGSDPCYACKNCRGTRVGGADEPYTKEQAILS